MSDLSSLMEEDIGQIRKSPLGTFDDSNLKGVAKLAQQITDQQNLSRRTLKKN